MELDLVIIGAGSAGEYAASHAAGGGRRVGLVEKDRVGGDCVFRACIPTKALVHAARLHKGMRNAGFFGLPESDAMPDYSRVKAFKDRIVGGIGGGRAESMSRRGVRVLEGEAEFVSPHEILIGEERVRAERFIVATGSDPSVPPVPGLEEAGYITNIEALELEKVPGRLAVIGGGPVGVEFAQIFSAFGARIHIFEMADRIVGGEDEEISAALEELLLKQGVALSTGVKVSGVEAGGGVKTVTAESGSGERRTAEFDEILVATGRRPAVDALNLQAAGLETGDSGIEVDSTLRTSVPHIWAAGDVTGPPYYTYTGNEEGRIAALNAITGGEREMRYDVLPRSTFCDPEIGSVGFTEAQAVERGFEVETGRFDYADMTRPIVSGETDGFIKIVADRDTGHIIGGHILGSEASTMIHEIALAVSAGLTAAGVGGMLHSYPTFSEGIGYACQKVGK